MRAGRSKAAIARHMEMTTKTLHEYMTGARPIPAHRRVRLSAAMGGEAIDWTAYEAERAEAQERAPEPRKLTRDPGPAPARQKPPEAPPAPPAARPAPSKARPASKPAAPPTAPPKPAPKAPPKKTLLFGFLPIVDDTEDEE